MDGQGILDWINNYLQSINLEGIKGGDLLTFSQQNPTDDGTLFKQWIRSQQAYKDRFAGNDARIKNGLAPLSESEYLSQEASYKHTLANFGLPSDFYGKDEFKNLIANDVSPNEVATRVQDTWDFVHNANPGAKQALRDFYGVQDDSAIAAYFLDPEKGQAIIDRQAMSANLAAQAKQSGLGMDRNMAESIAGTGKSQYVLDSAVKQAGADYSSAQSAASRFGESFTQNDAIQNSVFGSPDAQNKLKRLSQNEQALFQGGSGAVSDSGSKGAF